MPGQSAEAAGGEKNRSLEFHKNLGDERVHPLNELIEAFNLFEEHENWIRKTAPEMDLSDFLSHEENIHWGSIKYEFINPDTTHEEISIYLRYSPWMYHRKNTILKGRVILEKDMSEYDNIKELPIFGGSVIFNEHRSGKEIFTLELPKEYNESFVKRDVDFVTEGLVDI